MSTHQELAAALKRIWEATGDSNAWKTGLTTDEVYAAVAATTSPEQLEPILRKIREQHPDLFNPAGRPPAVGGPPPNGQQGDPAEAIAAAEAALAHQNTASSQLDLQVISAILNAHLKAVDGRDALIKLQQEIEAALRTRSDLDTPAGARDFQRFLIGKLRDIRAVVADASLDDTSKSALMAAWTSLYDASKHEANGPEVGGRPAPIAAQTPAPERGTTDAGVDPYLDDLLAEDPGLLAAGPPASGLTAAPTAPGTAMTPAIPNIPNLGGGLTPGGAMPSAMPGWGALGGLPRSGTLDGSGGDPALRGVDDERRLTSDGHESTDQLADDAHDKDGEDPSSTKPEPQPAGPTTVTLPNGETVTAASPQLAAAIKAAAGGAPIADAFRQQGITIPAPGTPVDRPIEPSRVTPGDIGMFTDRHALALGPSKAILDGQIQRLSTVGGPSFLGWEHPPAPVAQVPGPPPQTEAPTPTRPAATSVRWTTAQ